MKIGRPKAKISKTRIITIRVTDFEFEKISNISKKLGITKTETIIRAINIFENYKPKRYKSFSKNKKINEPGVVRENSKE